MSKGFSSPLSQITLSSIELYMKRHTYLTVAIVSWVVMIALSVLFVFPQGQRIVTETTQITLQQKKLSDATTKVAFLQALNGQDLERERTLLQTVLPSQKPVTPLISSMEKLAQDAGVTLKNFELNPGSVATTSATQTTTITKGFVPGVSSLPLKLEVQGGFAQMNTFFKSLDNLVPLVNVKTINFTQLSQNITSAGADAQYKASVELESLYELQDATVAKIDPNAVLTALSAQDNSLIASLSAQVAAQPAVTQTLFTSTPGSQSGTFRTTLFSY